MIAKAAVLDGRHGWFVVQPVEVDDPRPGEVLVRVVATGVCHTDAQARAGHLPFPLPGVLGHEGAGVVEAVGPGVTKVAPGDHVVLGWPSCGQCRNCLDGQPGYCLDLSAQLIGGRRADGSTALRRDDGMELAGHFFGQSSFATYALTTERAVVPVPADAPLELLGPLTCGLATGAGAVFTTLRPGLGSSLAVFGTGAVGLAAIMAARCSGATTIIGVDRHPHRLALARELGATDVVEVGEDAGAEPVAAIREICGGPADFSIECTGDVAVVRQAVDAVGMLGTCALVGAAPAGAGFELDHRSTLWGKRIVGVLGGGGRSEPLIGGLIELHRQGRFPFDRLVEFFELGQVNEALEACESGRVLSPVLRMPA